MTLAEDDVPPTSIKTEPRGGRGGSQILDIELIV